MRTPMLVTLVALVVGVAIDLVLGYSPIPGYAALLGLGGGAVLTLGSKSGVGRLVTRPEDHYADEVPADEQEDLRG